VSENYGESVGLGPSGVPYAYGIHGEPLTVNEAALLTADFEGRTMAKTDVVLPDGSPAVVRTMCVVYDQPLATSEVPKGYRPRAWGSALYGPEPENEFLAGLWEYDSPEEARAAHPEAVDEFRSGRAGVPVQA
jgi:hypothetical protein